MTRPARVIVDISALKFNLTVVREKVPRSKVMAIVKADGYGHGVNRVGKALASADAFGVASIEEAITLREGGAKNPIVLLEGPFESRELSLIKDYRLQAVVHTHAQLAMLVAGQCDVPLWIKVDSGMHRLGFHPDELPEILTSLGSLRSQIRCMTHLANADDRAHEYTLRQTQKFSAAIDGFRGETSIANSAGILAWPQTQSDWARPGIMLYGVSPFKDQNGEELGLKAAMTVKSEVISVRKIKAGESVGYGRGFVADREMTVGVVAFGYGDGYPRAAGTNTPILVNGRQTRVIGEASMDMLTIDLTSISNPRVGDEVTLWGAGLPVETIAKSANTIPYELLCRVRMRARYVEN
ncbi:MAG: alanine racemase [Gammaproteobacteria bacterium]